jgi:hypothetical protein
MFSHFFLGDSGLGSWTTLGVRSPGVLCFTIYFSTGVRAECTLKKDNVTSSVLDPDPYVLGLPDPHPDPLVTSTDPSHKYGSGSFHHQE